MFLDSCGHGDAAEIGPSVGFIVALPPNPPTPAHCPLCTAVQEAAALLKECSRSLCELAPCLLCSHNTRERLWLSTQFCGPRQALALHRGSDDSVWLPCSGLCEQVTQDADRVHSRQNCSPRERKGQCDLSYVKKSRMDTTHTTEKPESGRICFCFF